MIMRILSFLTSLLLLALMGCESDYLTGLTDEDLQLRCEEEMKTVPFHGEFVQTIAHDAVPLPGCGVPSRFLVSGNATHLGQLQGGCLNVLNCHFDPELNALVGDATGALIAANGDELHLEGVARAFANQTGNGDMTITGGTGRWENATGWIHTESQQTGGASTNVIATGEITSPGQAKK